MDTDTKIEAPKVLANGATVIDYTHLHDGGNGFKPHGIGLCKREDNSLHPYVTWTLYREPDGTWGAETGHYFDSIIHAAIDYAERGGL